MVGWGRAASTPAPLQGVPPARIPGLSLIWVAASAKFPLDHRQNRADHRTLKIHVSVQADETPCTEWHV